MHDLLADEEFLREVDLSNSKTDLANHNKREIHDLLNDFIKLRQITLSKLQNITEKEVYKYALHPRLKTPMRTMDLCLFVAEHHDHHLSKISEIRDVLK